MKINILDERSVLKSVELTNLQLKAIQLTGQKPEDYLADKLERILEFTVNQAKQTIDRISPLTETEMESIIDGIEAEKEVQNEPEKSQGRKKD